MPTITDQITFNFDERAKPAEDQLARYGGGINRHVEAKQADLRVFENRSPPNTIGQACQAATSEAYRLPGVAPSAFPTPAELDTFSVATRLHPAAFNASRRKSRFCSVVEAHG